MIWAAMAAQLADLATYEMAVRKYPWGESGVLAMFGLTDLWFPKLIGIALILLLAWRLPLRLRRSGLAIAAVVGLLGTATNLSALMI